uniref:Uncharacterized protein n=1 Tax=Panagrolaimus sp. ES5 TaxID=591445 RepID=A0AC34F8R4_9BILA
MVEGGVSEEKVELLLEGTYMEDGYVCAGLIDGGDDFRDPFADNFGDEIAEISFPFGVGDVGDTGPAK